MVVKVGLIILIIVQFIISTAKNKRAGYILPFLMFPSSLICTIFSNYMVPTDIPEVWGYKYKLLVFLTLNLLTVVLFAVYLLGRLKYTKEEKITAFLKDKFFIAYVNVVAIVISLIAACSIVNTIVYENGLRKAIRLSEESRVASKEAVELYSDNFINIADYALKNGYDSLQYPVDEIYQDYGLIFDQLKFKPQYLRIKSDTQTVIFIRYHERGEGTKMPVNIGVSCKLGEDGAWSLEAKNFN